MTKIQFENTKLKLKINCKTDFSFYSIKILIQAGRQITCIIPNVLFVYINGIYFFAYKYDI